MYFQISEIYILIVSPCNQRWFYCDFLGFSIYGINTTDTRSAAPRLVRARSNTCLPRYWGLPNVILVERKIQYGIQRRRCLQQAASEWLEPTQLPHPVQRGVGQYMADANRGRSETRGAQTAEEYGVASNGGTESDIVWAGQVRL